MKNKFEIKEQFELNGEELKIISGSIHYFRSMPETWEDKIIKLKALGANTVETYVPWNLHEPYEGTWTMEGHLNLPLFLELATKHDMLIIVRFGPYICAEHDFGGFPWWFLNKDMRLRCNDDRYLVEIEKYVNRICDVISPYCSHNGGNVIMGQVENEYGSFGNDKKYLAKLKTMIRKAGFEEELVTSDGTWSSMLEGGNMFTEGVLPTVNFGSKANEHFDYLEKFCDRKIPLMCMEFWCGWFSAWRSDKIITTDPIQTAKELDEILNRGSVNFYMFHGGTNFGAQAGANQADDRGYTPDTTSYDYDALLDERGNITQKYIECKKVISKYVDTSEVEFEYIPTKSYSNIKYIGSSNIFNNDKFEVVNSAYPQTMEELGYGFGYVLYESQLTDITKLKSIELQGCNDRALVFINDELVATSFVEANEVLDFDMEMPNNSRLSILVENTGRVNYGKYMEFQRKGITQGVFVNNHTYLFDWKMTKLPLEYSLYATQEYKDQYSSDPQVHKFELNIGDEQIEDTYIDTTDKGKGYIFVNGFNLGRFWDVGPQYKIYVPKQLLKSGSNEILVIDSDGKFDSLEFSE